MGMTASFKAVSPATLISLRDHPSQAEAFMFEEGPSQVDIDKAWHGIHYLLNGDPYGDDGPLALAILGGTEFAPGSDIRSSSLTRSRRLPQCSSR